ncbi:MAG: hypothetical protein WBA93_16365 [Microcoleaceae cyanobacterium]
MSKSPKSSMGTTVILVTLGLCLVVSAIIVLLQGVGILSSLPTYVIVSIVLLTVGIGIIAGVLSRNKT